MIRSTTFAGVSFAVTAEQMRPRLLELLTWLRNEEQRLSAVLTMTPAPKPEFDAMNRPVLTDKLRARQALESELASVRADMYGARSWLVECEHSQTWHISAEISGWLNRPLLTDSSNGG